MRNIVLVITTTILGVIVFMIVLTINGRMNRSMELTSNLSSVVEETVENMVLNPKYSIQNTNEFVADLTESLVMSIDATSNIKVDILQCDKERGILAIKVALSYLHPNGNSGEIVCEKIAIFNKVIEEETRQYRVTFYVGSDIYKEYVVPEGAVLAYPIEPVLLDGIFLGWVNETGSTVEFSKPITEDVVCFACIGS